MNGHDRAHGGDYGYECVLLHVWDRVDDRDSVHAGDSYISPAILTGIIALQFEKLYHISIKRNITNFVNLYHYYERVSVAGVMQSTRRTRNVGSIVSRDLPSADLNSCWWDKNWPICVHIADSAGQGFLRRTILREQFPSTASG